MYPILSCYVELNRLIDAAISAPYWDRYYWDMYYSLLDKCGLTDQQFDLEMLKKIDLSWTEFNN